MTPADVEAAKARLASARAGLQRRAVTDIVTVLGRVGARFADPDDPLRAAALERIPGEAALSPEMARVVLDGMAADWTTARLERLLREEFADPAVLDGVVERAPTSSGGPSRRVMALGPTCCVQIASGGVPGVGVNALLRSLLVKAPTLIKPGAGDVVLTKLFAEALAEADADLGAAVEVPYWPGEAHELTATALEDADVVVAYGSDESVGAVRAMVPVTTRFVAYHHRFGVGLVGRGALGEDAPGIAREVARAVAMFEHRGCVCPHVVFVEEGGPVVPEAFAELVAKSLEDLARSWPGPPADDDSTLPRLRQVRDTVEIHEAAGAVRMLHGGLDDWTVVFESDLVEVPALPGRGVRIRAVGDLSEVPTLLGPAGRHLQSVGYAVARARVTGLAKALGRAGASRVVPFARVSFPPAWWLHDGRGPLETLVRWVEVE